MAGARASLNVPELNHRNLVWFALHLAPSSNCAFRLYRRDHAQTETEKKTPRRRWTHERTPSTGPDQIRRWVNESVAAWGLIHLFMKTLWSECMWWPIMFVSLLVLALMEAPAMQAQQSVFWNHGSTSASQNTSSTGPGACSKTRCNLCIVVSAHTLLCQMTS